MGVMEKSSKEERVITVVVEKWNRGKVKMSKSVRMVDALMVKFEV